MLNEAGEVVDFAFAYLNPAARQLLRLPPQPTTYREELPKELANQAFAFHREAWGSEEACHFDLIYQVAGYDSCLRLAARRLGQQLLVSLTQLKEPARPAAEQALRESQAREQAARAEAERQRGELERIFEQAPVAIATYRGPHYVIELANPLVCALWGRTPKQAVGTPLFELLPEIVGQGYEELLNQVLTTGEPHVATEMPSTIDRNGRREMVYWNFVYLPLREADGRVTGVMVVATEVSEQVQARQLVQDLNDQLAATNQELYTSNEELLANQHELLLIQQQLEASGQARTQRAQATAEHQRARLARLIEEAPAAVCMLDGPDFVFELVNPAYQALFGGRPQPGLALLAALPELADHQALRTLREVYNTGRTNHEVGILVPITRADGQLEDRYFNYTQQARYNELGQIDGILVFAFEMTEQLRTSQQLAAALRQAKQQRGQLTEQQRLLSQILGQVPASIATLTGPEHRYAFFNEGYQALTEGRTQLGLTVADVLPEVVTQGFIELLNQVYTTGEPFQGREMPIQLVNPSTGQPELRYVDFVYQPLTDEQGRTLGILAFIVDVTEKVVARQHAEALQAQLLATTQRQVQEREELFQVFEQAPVVIALLRGPEHFFYYCNPAFQALFPGRVLAGQLYADAMPEIVAAGLMAQLDQVYTTGLTYYGYALPLVTTPRDGAASHLRYYDFSYQAHREEGRIGGIAIFAYDVTEQVQARQQVQELNDELATSNAAVRATNQELSETNTQLTRTNADLDTFVYAASHDLKAPIANIEGLLDALRYYLPANGPEPMVPHLLGLMQQAVARFQQTVGHLTDISRLTQEQITETVVLADIVAGVRLDLTGLLESTHAELHLNVAGCPPLRLSVKNLRSIVFNLLSNALKYHAPDRLPVVHIRAYPTADAVLLTVQDNGLGLSTVQQSRLFTMFRRLHDHVEGSGVGLYMVKRIVENAGGTITVQSEPGVGSTFTVSLPHILSA
ncbi:hypothetical protein A8B98_15045 [Hymenobacter sp. UV11]|nr:hypothetical protein A8B98_15045 [Hymenobacter sp. UV11]